MYISAILIDEQIRKYVSEMHFVRIMFFSLHAMVPVDNKDFISVAWLKRQKASILFKYTIGNCLHSTRVIKSKVHRIKTQKY